KSDAEELTSLCSQLALAASKCLSPAALRRALAELKELNGSAQIVNQVAAKAKDDANAVIADPKGSGAQALAKLREAPGVFGLDIGGTLAKMAHMLPADEQFEMPLTFGKSGKFHGDLSFKLSLNGIFHEVRFVSGTTELLEKVLRRENKEDRSNGHDGAAPRVMRRVVAAGGGAHRLADLLLQAFAVEVVPFKEMESIVSGISFLHAHGPADEVFEVLPGGEQNTVAWPLPLFPCIIVNIGSGVSILRVDAGAKGEPKTFTRLGGTATGGATFLGLSKLLTSAKTFSEALELARRGDAAKVNKLVSDIYGHDGCENLGLPANMTAAHFGKLVRNEAREGCNEADVAAALLIMVTQASAVLAKAFAQAVQGSQVAPVPASAPACFSPAERPRSKLPERSQTAPLDDLRELSPHYQQWLTATPMSRRTKVKANLLGAAEVAGARRTPVFFVGGFLTNNSKAWDLISRQFRNLECGPAYFLRHADFLGTLGAVAATFSAEDEA
ncbi:unnamed protein product, partial [Polarella glacialis]